MLAFLQQGLQFFDPSAPLIPLTRACPGSEHAAVLERIGDRRAVVVAAIVKNYAGDPYKGLLSQGTVELLRSLDAAGKQLTLVLLGSPYPAAQAPASASIICTGGDTLGSAAGALERLTFR